MSGFQRRRMSENRIDKWRKGVAVAMEDEAWKEGQSGAASFDGFDNNPVGWFASARVQGQNG